MDGQKGMVHQRSRQSVDGQKATTSGSSGAGSRPLGRRNSPSKIPTSLNVFGANWLMSFALNEICRREKHIPDDSTPPKSYTCQGRIQMDSMDNLVQVEAKSQSNLLESSNGGKTQAAIMGEHRRRYRRSSDGTGYRSPGGQASTTSPVPTRKADSSSSQTPDDRAKLRGLTDLELRRRIFKNNRNNSFDGSQF